MDSRKHLLPVYEGSSVPAPGLMHHGPLPIRHPLEPLPPPELLENRLAIQAAEIEQLAGDNHRLAATHVALRRDLVAAQEEINKLGEFIRSQKTESDMQIRVLMDKIANMEVDIRAGETVKKDLQQAHSEARSLVLARKELTAQIEQATRDLEKASADAKRLPEMHAELDSLRQEHQRLRVTFEYEKGLNIDRVERMQIMEKDMVGMAAELERLRAEVLNAEKRAHSNHSPNPYGIPYISPPSVHVSGGYVDHYRRLPSRIGAGAMAQRMIPYGSGVIAFPPGVAAGAAAIGAGDNPARMQAYDASQARK